MCGEYEGLFLANIFRNIEFGVTFSLGGCVLVGVERLSLNGLEGEIETDERSMMVLLSAQMSYVDMP